MIGVRRYRGLFAVLCAGVVVASFLAPPVHAAGEGNFSLQVSPSPLVATVKPGETRELELKIRNASTSAEELKIEPQSFHFDSLTGEIKLDDKTPPEAGKWISFSDPSFVVKPGEWFTQKVTVALPEQTGFSYSLALVVSRTTQPVIQGAGQQLRGSVAVFTLINVRSAWCDPRT